MKSKKEQEIPLEYLTEEQLDDFLEYSQPFTKENLTTINRLFEEKIGQAERSKGRGFRKKYIWLMAAVAIVLLTVGFTQFDALRKAYYQLFGIQAEKILLDSDTLGETVEDQGIRLKALAAFEDGDMLYFIYELTDIEGDRLSEELQLVAWWLGNSVSSNVVSYDTENKTAIVLAKTFQDSRFKSEMPWYSVETILSHPDSFEETVPINLAEQRLDKAGWGKGDVPIQGNLNSITELNTNLPGWSIFERKEIQLSGLGYRDGRLHIEIGTSNSLMAKDLWLTLVNKETGEVVQPDYSVASGVSGEEHPEFVFLLNQTELTKYDIRINGAIYQTSVEGKWLVKLAAPSKLSKRKLRNQELLVDGRKVVVQNIEISPIGIRFSLAHGNGLIEESDALSKFDIQVKLNDGSIIKYVTDLTLFSSMSTEGLDSTFCFEGEYLELKNIEKITINDTELDWQE